MYWILFLTVALGVGAGTFLGLVICANITLGNFSFEEPRKELARCAAVALVTAGVSAGLLALSRDPRVFLAALPVWYILMKLCWLDIETAEIAVVGGTCLCSLALAVVAAVLVFR